MSEKVGVTSKRLARVHVAQVHFDEGNPHREQGIAERDARMGECPRVEEDEIHLVGRAALDAIDQLVLGIALVRDQRVLSLGRKVGQSLFDGRKRVPAVERGFPGAQQVEVGPIKKKQSSHPPEFYLSRWTQMAASLSTDRRRWVLFRVNGV